MTNKIERDKLFDVLVDVLDLYRRGRKNAAVAKFEDLPKDFKIRVIRWVAEIYELGPDMKTGDVYKLKTPFGILVLVQELFDDLQEIIPEIINGPVNGTTV
jgi:hypothetical protein